ncbi:hypothetical protein ACBJ59_53000 [Nonomuraea sp. MTCD27]|uniref:hypothetical protein n=1 Tax=Nonomuraea sp. MTCD27 TaxID=1676747 RepID=UPI0035C04C49
MSTFFTYGLTAGVTVAAAQSRYGVAKLERTLLAAQGLLPWRFMRFLDTAYEQGVLSRNGPSYRFRHPLLARRLASRGSGRRGTWSPVTVPAILNAPRGAAVLELRLTRRQVIASLL